MRRLVKSETEPRPSPRRAAREPGAGDQREVDGKDRRDGRDDDHARQHRVEGAPDRPGGGARIDRAPARD